MEEYESLSHSKWECKYHVYVHSQVSAVGGPPKAAAGVISGNSVHLKHP